MMRTGFVAFVGAIVLSACGGHSWNIAPQSAADDRNIVPQVNQNGTEAGGQWRAFSPHTVSTAVYRGMVVGHNRNVYFADDGANRLARISMFGAATEFATGAFAPDYQAVGSDGKFYMICDDCTTAGGHGIIGVSTTNGGLVTHATTDTQGTNELGLGSDGNVWFAERAHIGRITPAGVVTEFRYPSGSSNNRDAHPVAAPDGNVWFTEIDKDKVAHINPSTHVITEKDVSGTCHNPHGMVVGPDNALYMMCNFVGLARMTTAGAITAFSLAGHGTSETGEELAKGLNGHIFFVSAQPNELGEFNPATHAIMYHDEPVKTGLINDIIAGPDGNIWGTEGSTHVDVFILDKLTVTPTSLSFTASGQVKTITATYTGPSVLTATSANTAIATVAPGAVKNTFNVTSHAAGNTSITVQDAIGNSFIVVVHVL